MMSRSCLPHPRSLHKTHSGLLRKEYKNEPEQERPQDQKAPLLKSLLILFNAFAVTSFTTEGIDSSNPRIIEFSKMLGPSNLEFGHAIFV